MPLEAFWNLMPAKHMADGVQDDVTSCMLLDYKEGVILFSLAAVRALSADACSKLELRDKHTLVVMKKPMCVDTRVKHIQNIAETYLDLVDSAPKLLVREQAAPRLLGKTSFLKHYKLRVHFEDGGETVDFVGVKLWELDRPRLHFAFQLLLAITYA